MSTVADAHGDATRGIYVLSNTWGLFVVAAEDADDATALLREWVPKFFRGMRSHTFPDYALELVKADDWTLVNDAPRMVVAHQLA